MKKIAFILAVLLAATAGRAQETPCQDDDDVARMPAPYFDHTRPKYPMNIGPYSAQEKAVIMKRLTEIEKVEEKSRAGFQATGCVLRVSFSGRPPGFFGVTPAAGYGYQLAAYKNVCHIRQHVVKTVDEYTTVLRVDINPFLGAFYGQTNNDFYITDKRVRYNVSIGADDALINTGYLQKHAGSRVSQWLAQDQVADSKSDFDKINMGNGWVENVMMGSDPKKYQWLDRHYYITKNGAPLLAPVSRKEYLEGLLEYYDIEKKNFQLSMGFKIADDSRSTSDATKQRLGVYEADKIAYQKIYEAKVANVKKVLADHDADWLSKQAVVKSRFVRENDYAKASNGLLDFVGFADNEEGAHRLFQYNFGVDKQVAKPFFMRVQFRYEMGRYYSESLFKNFEKNFDFGALRKMLE